MSEDSDFLRADRAHPDGRRQKRSGRRIASSLSNQPLRVRLVAVSVLLVTVGLVAAGALATTSLRGYLYDRVDGQLQSAVRQVLGRTAGSAFNNGSGPGGGPPSQYYVRYADADGQEIRVDDNQLRGRSSSTPKLPQHKYAQVTNDRRPYTVSSTTPDGDSDGGVEWRVIEVPASFVYANGVTTSGTIAVATPLDEVARTTSRLVKLELIVGAMVIVILVFVSYVVVRRALRPLLEVEQTAEAIAAGDMSLRVKESDPRTEVGSLSHSFNTMLSHIESAFQERAASEAAARTSEGRMRRFVADASHELRTPLTSIRGFAELHRQGAIRDTDGVERAMTRIESEAKRMGVLVDDLLLLARLDQQRPLELKDVDVPELVTDVVHAVLGAAPDHPVTLICEPGLRAVVIADQMRLRQVISNLLSNAVVHTPSGTPVEISVMLRESNAVVEVRDHGPGLSPEDAARVFERFYRADSSRTKATGGSGLGLSIVAALVAAHNGTMELDTEAGQGAAFRVVLPLKVGNVPAESGTSPAE